MCVCVDVELDVERDIESHTELHIRELIALSVLSHRGVLDHLM